MNSKIGLCIAYREGHNNYGTSLVGFSLLKTVQDLGYTCEVIHYKKNRDIYNTLSDAPFMLISGGIKTLMNKIKVKRNLRKYPNYAQGIQKRTKAVNSYKGSHLLPYMKTFTGYESLKAGAFNYNLVLVGSDQVWLPLGLYTKFFNLLFVDDSICKMAYSSSFGVSSIPFWQKRQTKNYLNRLNAIGVRESRGKQIVEEISDNSATVVLDPTLLVPNEVWEMEIESCKLVTDQDFIFCYFLGNNSENRDAAKKLSADTGLPIVFCPHMDEYIEADESFGAFSVYEFSPNDFVNHIKNAQYVLTDSFHATIFSIHFCKQFLTFYRFQVGSSNSRNSRIDSLFSLLDLQERLYCGDHTTMKKPIDYERVSKIVSELRAGSMRFLHTNIQKCLGEM